MSKIIHKLNSGDAITADSINDGQVALGAIQKIRTSGGIRASFSGGVLSISYVGDSEPARYGFMAEIADYDSASDRYSFTRAALSGSATGDGIAQKIEPSGDTKNFDDQFVAIEVTGNVSVPIGAMVFIYPLKTTENGASLYAFAYGARILFCKISDDTAGGFEANPCEADGTNPNTNVDISISEPIRGRLYFEVDDVIRVLIKGGYSGGGPYTIAGEYVSDHAPRYISELFKITSPTAVTAANNGPGSTTTEWTYTASAVDYNATTGAYGTVTGYLQSKAALNTLEYGNRSVSTGSGTFGNGVTYDMLCTDGTGDDPTWTGKLLSVPADAIVSGFYDPVADKVFFSVPNGIDGDCDSCT